jgi:ribonuclease R
MSKRRSRSVSESTQESAREGASAAAATRRVESPRDVLDVIRDAGVPLKWPEIRDLAGAHRGAEADRLRRLLRGLCHTGELHLDEHGAYHLDQAGETLSGVVTADSEHRFVVVDGAARRWPVRLGRTGRVRVGDSVEARVVSGQAVVTRVTAFSPTPVVGRFSVGRQGGYVSAEGAEFRGRVFILPGREHRAQDGDTVAARVLDEESYGLVGEVIERVASRDDLHLASTTMLAAYAVPTDWPDDVHEAVAELPGVVSPVLPAGRRDLRDLPLVTIDGEDARDFDDAVYCEIRPRGGFRLVVAIADVAQYVGDGDALDRSARERGNSVYLPDRVVPMLPEALSNDLCSLKPDVPRLALVCDMRLAAGGRVTAFEFYEALIHSKARLTYTQAAAFLAGDDPGLSPPVAASLTHLHALYRVLRDEREARGALDFESREQKLVLDNGLLERVVPVERNDAHRLIEEAMVTANICAAKFLAKEGRRFLYRVHEGPTPEKYEDLRATLAIVGIRAPKTLPGVTEMKHLVDLVSKRPDRALLETLILRSMQQAVYSPRNRGHFGLALSHYAHFTSPIRRYADLLVHRAIKSVLRADREEDPPHLEEIGEHISYTERRADEVSRGVADWLKCEFAAGFIGETFEGTVVSVAPFGLFVELDRVLVQGLLHISNLGSDYFEALGGGLAIVGTRSGARFALGDRLRVVLADVNVEERKIDLLLEGRRRDSRERQRPERKGRRDGRR